MGLLQGRDTNPQQSYLKNRGQNKAEEQNSTQAVLWDGVKSRANVPLST